MRAISPNARYSLQLIEAPVKRGTDAQGTVVEYSDTKPVIAHFEKLGLTDEEQIAALEHFSFSGLPDGVNPLTTVSVWDSEGQAIAHGWSPELLAQVDKRLAFLATQHPANLLVVTPTPKIQPWPTYDQAEPKEIFETMRITGISPEIVRLYEQENLQREDVIVALEAIAEGTTNLQTVVEAYSDVDSDVESEDDEDDGAEVLPAAPQSPQVPQSAPEAPVVAYEPPMVSPGRWQLSDGTIFVGKKVAALEAQAALPSAAPQGGEQVVEA